LTRRNVFARLIVELVAGLVNLTTIVEGGLVVAGLLFARGLVERSFVISKSRSRSL
jgi:hypothetical protein